MIEPNKAVPDSSPDEALDAYRPARIAERIEAAGVAKANLGLLETLTLSILAGAFIAFGAMFYTVVVTDTGLGFGPTRLLGGLAFSLGLILVVVAGAELFTGNNLIVMAWADGQIGLGALLRNWGIVYGGNFLGAAASAILIHWSGTLAMQNGAVGETALAIAGAKVSLTIEEAFVRGILCNALVCLAIWLSYAARRVSGKILAIVFPITAFVALGFEHSVANMYFIPVAIMQSGGVTVGDLLYNLVPVTLGNIVGGAGFVGLVYWIVYCRSDGTEE
ncbi:MAG: formate/nitrite transporter [Alphaproteobacteria bacterium]